MSALDHALLALLLPAAAAALLAIVPPLRRGRLAATISIAAAAASLLFAFLSWHQRGEWTVPWLPGMGHSPLAEIGVRLDGISTSMLLAVGVVALSVQVFSVSYLHGEDDKAIGRYFAYQSLFIFSMDTLVLAPNLLQLFAGWELVGVTSYLLIGHYYRKPAAGRAAVKAFWVTKLADSGLILALLVVFTATGSFYWDVPMAVGAATLASLGLLFAVAGKSAQFPLHVWLPDAMEGPTPVSALLHAATMVAAGVYLVVRTAPLFAQAPVTGEVMAWLGAFTAIFAACLAVVQSDIKKMLAYSTCSQLGYMVSALGAGAVMGGYFHLLTHAAFKALLFLAAGNVIHAVGSNELSAMGGLSRKMKLTTAAFVVGALALAGVPGFAGSFSKDAVLDGVLEHGMIGPYVLLMASVPITGFYVGRATLRAFFGAPSPATEHAHEAPAAMLLPVLALSVPAVAAGFFGNHVAAWLGTTWTFELSATTAVAAGLALAGLATAWASLRPGPVQALADRFVDALDALARGAYVDRAWVASFRSGFLPVSSAAGWFDRYIVDGLINTVGAGILSAGRRLRAVQTGHVPDYLLAVTSAVVLLAIWGVFS